MTRYLLKYTIVCITILLTSFIAHGQSIDRARQQKKALENEIQKIDKQLSSTQKKKEANIYNLNLTRKRIEYRKKLIIEIDHEITGYDTEISRMNGIIAGLNSRLDTLELYYNRFVLNAYKNRDSKVWFMYILASDNISQGIRRWSYLKNMNRSIEQQAETIRNTRKDITDKTVQLNELKAQALKTRDEKQKEYNNLKKDEIQYDRTVNNLKKQEQNIKRQLASKKKEVDKLNRKIEQILAEEIRKQKEKDKTAKTEQKVNIKLSGEFANNKKKLPWPVNNGVIVQGYGQSYHPVFKSLKLPFNNGVDISAPRDSEALCVFQGEVKQILIMPGYSQCVLVQHGEYFTFYCKLRTVSVKTGQKVKTGQPLGIIDTSENGNAVLHFQLWKGTAKQNPELWLR